MNDIIPLGTGNDNKKLSDVKLLVYKNKKDAKIILVDKIPSTLEKDTFVIEKFENESNEMYAQCLEWLMFFIEDNTKLTKYEQFRNELKEALNKKPSSSKNIILKPHYRTMIEMFSKETKTFTIVEPISLNTITLYDIMFQSNNYITGIYTSGKNIIHFFIFQKNSIEPYLVIKDDKAYIKTIRGIINSDYTLGDSIQSLFIKKSVNLLATLQGHTDLINDVAFSPDGKILASASFDKTVRLWNVANGNSLREPLLTGHIGVVYSVAFSPDGATLASASSDKTVRLWNVANGNPIKALQGNTAGVESVVFSPDGKMLASSLSNYTVRLWRVADGHSLETLKNHKEDAKSVAFSPDSKMLAIASSDNTVRLWSIADGELLHTLLSHSRWVNDVAFSPDGKILASASDDHTICIWNVSNYELLCTIEGHTESVNCVAFSPDGKTLASASDDSTVCLWNISDVKSCKLLATLQGHTGSVRSVAFSPDGKTLASASEDETIRLWNLNLNQDHLTKIDSIPGLEITKDGTEKCFDIKMGSHSLLKLYPYDILEGQPATIPDIEYFKNHKNEFILKPKDSDVEFNLSSYFENLKEQSGGSLVYKKTTEKRVLMGRERVIYMCQRRKYIKSKGEFIPLKSLRK